MESISRMVLFARLVEAKSFSGAAKQLDVSASLVSKQINGLEQALGVRLLNRTTRALSLTEAGAAFYKHCAEMVAIAERAEADLAELQGGPRGTLKVTGATTFGLLHVAPAIPAFLARYPDISVDVTFYDRVVDIAAEGYDVAIRIGGPVHPGLVARRHADLSRESPADGVADSRRNAPARGTGESKSRGVLRVRQSRGVLRDACCARGERHRDAKLAGPSRLQRGGSRALSRSRNESRRGERDHDGEGLDESRKARGGDINRSAKGGVRCPRIGSACGGCQSSAVGDRQQIFCCR